MTFGSDNGIELNANSTISLESIVSVWGSGGGGGIFRISGGFLSNNDDDDAPLFYSRIILNGVGMKPNIVPGCPLTVE